MKMSIAGSGLLDPQQLLSMPAERRREMLDRTRAGYRNSLDDAKSIVRSHVASRFRVSRANFSNIMRGNVQAKDQSKLPLMVFWPTAGWLAAHQTGATITGRAGRGVIIPLNSKLGRIGYRQWQRTLRELASQGNLDFRRVGGRVLVFAETAGSGRALRNHKRGRQREIVIGVLVPRVRLRPRLQLEMAASAAAGVVANHVQTELAR